MPAVDTWHLTLSPVQIWSVDAHRQTPSVVSKLDPPEHRTQSSPVLALLYPRLHVHAPPTQSAFLPHCLPAHASVEHAQVVHAGGKKWVFQVIMPQVRHWSPAELSAHVCPCPQRQLPAKSVSTLSGHPMHAFPTRRFPPAHLHSPLLHVDPAGHRLLAHASGTHVTLVAASGLNVWPALQVSRPAHLNPVAHWHVPARAFIVLWSGHRKHVSVGPDFLYPCLHWHAPLVEASQNSLVEQRALAQTSVLQRQSPQVGGKKWYAVPPACVPRRQEAPVQVAWSGQRHISSLSRSVPAGHWAQDFLW